MPKLNRRQIFRWSAASAAAPAFLQAQTREPRSVIFMVSDGMSAGVLPMADAFSKIVRGKGTVWYGLLRRPDVTRGFFDMASLNSMVTDSSAASSSWGSGSRIFNAAVNVLPDGTKMTPIGVLARDRAKRKLGLVTTATVTHATPAGFVAVSPRRDDEDFIATQYLDVVDVVLGGGRRFFEAGKRKDKRDLAGDFRNSGYQVSFTKGDLKSAPSRKLLGLYDDSHVPYTLDWRADKKLQANVPTLAEMTRVALDSLDDAPNGFLLQVEGARIDHAAHANDAAAMLWDQLAFDDAIQTVVEYCAKRPDTLVVITSDHGNSNPGLFGVGKEYELSNTAFRTVAKAKYSFTQLSKELGSATDYKGLTIETKASAAPRSGFVKQVFLDSMGFEINDEEAKIVQLAVGRGRLLSANRQLDNLPGILGQVVGNHNGVGWVGTTHTADYTLTTSFGPGADAFSGLLRNVDAFPRLTRALGFEYVNPSMDPDKAGKFAALAPRRDRADWA
jgi:alkaline phosphatase